ncbi:hypothetical protein SAMN04487996_11252 [Dyadobacter soli]|uniref:Lipocalin-like domain-containing protein n=1 Tax=Dyadobacter soli TaxID=659014 RepID=A0A1G7NJ33_9BACT|nr:hypothetical protein [Dyadobacter soli]SDF73280.1 hypothetical protein SAMN04487996_11252 [Dyadobacter soli]
MKKLVFYVVMTFCGLLNVSAGCSEEKEKAPESNNAALMGYWKLKGGATEWKKRGDGNWIKKGTINPGTIAYEFFADKTFISYDLTNHFPAVKGTWKLDILSLDGKDVSLADIYFYSDTFKETDISNALEKDGSMKFRISIENFNGVQQLDMTSKEIELAADERHSHVRNYFIFTKEK